MIDHRTRRFDQQYGLILADVSADDPGVLHPPVHFVHAVIEVLVEPPLLLALLPRLLSIRVEKIEDRFPVAAIHRAVVGAIRAADVAAVALERRAPFFRRDRHIDLNAERSLVTAQRERALRTLP